MEGGTTIELQEGIEGVSPIRLTTATTLFYIQEFNRAYYFLAAGLLEIAFSPVDAATATLRPIAGTPSASPSSSDLVGAAETTDSKQPNGAPEGRGRSRAGTGNGFENLKRIRLASGKLGGRNADDMLQAMNQHGAIMNQQFDHQPIGNPLLYVLHNDRVELARLKEMTLRGWNNNVTLHRRDKITDLVCTVLERVRNKDRLVSPDRGASRGSARESARGSARNSRRSSIGSTGSLQLAIAQQAAKKSAGVAPAREVGVKENPQDAADKTSAGREETGGGATAGEEKKVSKEVLARDAKFESRGLLPPKTPSPRFDAFAILSKEAGRVSSKESLPDARTVGS